MTGVLSSIVPRSRLRLILLAGAMCVLPVMALAEDAKNTDTAKPEAAKSSSGAAQQPSYPGQAPGYPGGEEGKRKLEATMGALNVRFYGTVLLNFSTTDSVQVGQDVPLWPIPGSVPISFPDGSTRRAGLVGDTIFTARQSVLGFTFGPSKPSSDGWNPSGVLEFDFFGSRPVDGLQPQARTFNQPRVRLAYFQLEKGNIKIVAGQDKVILAPLDPVSLSHVAVPLGATAGNLWGWLPQFRVEYKQKFGETTALYQFGVLRPQFADSRITGELPASGTAVDVASSGIGERSNTPFFQGRIALSHPMSGSTTTVGASAHYGRERIGADRTIDSWAFAVDYEVPVVSRVILRGEGYLGSNLVPFQGGILQGLAIFTPPGAPRPLKINKIGDGGGWAELTFRATEDNKNIFYLGAGTDDPRDRHLLPLSNKSKNSFLWASYFRKLTSDVTLALEYSFWDFRSRSFNMATGALGPRSTSGRGNVVNVALAYQF